MISYVCAELPCFYFYYFWNEFCFNWLFRYEEIFILLIWSININNKASKSKLLLMLFKLDLFNYKFMFFSTSDLHGSFKPAKNSSHIFKFTRKPYCSIWSSKNQILRYSDKQANQHLKCEERFFPKKVMLHLAVVQIRSLSIPNNIRMS